ncbi:MAG TPA: polymer-forming cytoskeletal protein [Verrucomicrobiae bacterium]|jgi:cytoskeletal protein CcmA (bactofilin family)/ribosomal protein S27E|nr:polymer-forming cytoskeletal protein [Verrucomicrobiae bacterium]
MPALKQDQVLVACPHCGHQQPEWRSAFSTNCRKCGRHYRVQEALNPAPRAPDRAPPQRRIICFECGTELDVPASAESTMCKRCSRYVDLHDYDINTAVSKNFKTKGRFVVQPKGYVFNTETIAWDVIVKGRFHGKLTAEQSLTIYTGAEIKGPVSAAHLIIPAENHFRWPAGFKIGSAEIAGELAATVQATGTVTLKSTARWFGDLTAKNLVVEEGAVIVGALRIGF